MARRMRGYADAQARQIFRDLIDMPADVSMKVGGRSQNPAWRIVRQWGQRGGTCTASAVHPALRATPIAVQRSKRVQSGTCGATTNSISTAVRPSVRTTVYPTGSSPTTTAHAA